MSKRYMAHEVRAIRGRILKVLEISYPIPANDHIIGLTLSDAQYQCSPAEVRVYLAYLAEKGYVELAQVNEEAFGDGDRCMAKLTARGKDLLEGSIPPDPGVDLDG